MTNSFHKHFNKSLYTLLNINGDTTDIIFPWPASLYAYHLQLTNSTPPKNVEKSRPRQEPRAKSASLISSNRKMLESFTNSLATLRSAVYPLGGSREPLSGYASSQ